MTTAHPNPSIIVRSQWPYRLFARGATEISLAQKLLTVGNVPGLGRVVLPVEEIAEIVEERSWVWARLTIRARDGAVYTLPVLPKGKTAQLVASLHDEVVRLAAVLDDQIREQMTILDEAWSGERYLGAAESKRMHDRAEQLLDQTQTAYMRSGLTRDGASARERLSEIVAADYFERARIESNRRCVLSAASDVTSRLLRRKSARLAEQAAGDLLQLDERLSVMFAANRYVRYGDGEQLRQQIELVVGLASPRMIRAQISADALPALERLEALVPSGDFERARAEVNQRVVSAALPAVGSAMQASFDMTPTDEQAAAIAHDEEATLVLAGAGTGKTRVIVGKVAHLVRNQGVLPEEILVLAYNRDAAQEIRDRLGSDLSGVAVRTFHAFGGQVIGATSSAPKISHLARDDATLVRAVDQIIDDMMSSTEDAVPLSEFAAYHSQPYRSPFDFENLSDYRGYVRGIELRTLSGGRVESYEELEIANFLTLNGIPFQYEAPFRAVTADPRHRQYQPDFYLPEHDIYIEHFALNADGQAPSGWSSYREGVSWKRNLHRRYGTQLIETFSWQNQNGTLLQELERQLRDHGVRFEPTPIERLLDNLRDVITSWLARLLVQFLNLVKTAGLAMDDLRKRVTGLADSIRHAAFLDLFERVWNRYERVLEADDAIDFHDQINHAADAIRQGQWESPFRYVLVDEFQDISSGRLALLEALNGPDVGYFLVGDDWQSIYRFAGSDVSLMSSCGEHLGFVERCDLTRTFRHGASIAGPASTFVQRNSEQTARTLQSGDVDLGEGLTIIAADAATGAELAFDDIGELVISRDDLRILILGRYRRSRQHIRTLLSRPNVEFSTIHSAKGREADYVIVLDLNDGYPSFPSTREDDPLLNIVLHRPNAFPHAEERRLFYVAMTRARHGVYLVANAERPSTFVEELKRDHPDLRQIGQFTSDDAPPCPRCGGLLVASRSSKNLRCTNHPFCGYLAPRCRGCARGYLIIERDQARCSDDECMASIEPCPQCKFGVLQIRSGRRGSFWGCTEYYAEPPCTYTRDAAGAENHPQRSFALEPTPEDPQ